MMHTNRYKSYRSEFNENLLGAAVGVFFIVAPVALHLFGIIGG